MTTQRDKFFKIIGDAYKNGRNDLVIITADMGAAALNEFKNDPNFLINIGPSEQLAATMAAGLALKGKKPYIYGIDPFITMRALEQIRVSICSMNLPVTIVGIGAGLSYDTAGVTHHGTETLGCMRCLPNMTIANISTLEMAENYAKFSLDHNTPLYIRLDKLSINASNFVPDLSMNRGGWYVKDYGRTDYPVIITTGVLGDYLMKSFPKYGIIEVYEFPCAEHELKHCLINTPIFSVEEGYISGGLGDYLSSFLPNVKKVGFTSFCDTGPREEYWKLLLNEVLNATK
jgi:transketolase